MNEHSLEQTEYRVVEKLKNLFAQQGKETTEKVIWQGTDLHALSTKYPPSEIWGADRLSRTEAEDGYLVWTFRFERKLPGKEWEECDDPRHRVVTQQQLEIEREADAYNRRMFPGDYYDEDDYDEYDHPYDDDLYW